MFQRTAMLLTAILFLAACTGRQPIEVSAPTNPPPTQTEDDQHTSVPIGSMSPMDPAQAHMMSPIDGPSIQPPSAERGAQPLPFRMEDGVKVFELTTQLTRWSILDLDSGSPVTVTAMTYNGMVPGPLIRVTEGEQIRVVVHNQLPEPTTIHWHGVEVPNAMDGVPDMTQPPIQPGETFTYEFTARPAGTFIYHSHYEGDRQVSTGLYAPLIIDPAEPESNPPDIDAVLMLSEWLERDGLTYAAMPMMGMEPNYFTINGKAFPSTETIRVKVGQRVRLRFIGIGQFIHPMHLHGFSFKITASDGHPVPQAAQLTKDTLSIAPGERYDVEFTATETGKWMLHCHILHHTTNNNVEPGGLMLVVEVTP